jgi:hypothetical protein
MVRVIMGSVLILGVVIAGLVLGDPRYSHDHEFEPDEIGEVAPGTKHVEVSETPPGERPNIVKATEQVRAPGTPDADSPPPPEKCVRTHQVTTVVTAVARIRAGPSFSYGTAARAERGTDLIVVGEDGPWFHVWLGDAELGWIHRDIVSPVTTVESVAEGPCP